MAAGSIARGYLTGALCSLALFAAPTPTHAADLTQLALNSEANPPKNPAPQSPAPNERSTTIELPKPEFVTADPQSHIFPPSVVPPVRINPEAPGPFKAMVMANQSGDRELAVQYADTFVKYMVNVMFEAREYTQLIGEALVKNGVIDEEDWVGVGQFMNVQAARSRQEDAAVLAATHEMSLQRIKPDPKGEAAIYVFCAIGSHWCREMGPDVERLWRYAQTDPKIKMTVMSVDKHSDQYMKAFKSYTGLTAPIKDGAEVAKAFRVKFLPAVVIVAPNLKKAYLRTGAQEFSRLYEFVRTVQGQSKEPNALVTKLASATIGEIAVARASGKPLLWEEGAGKPSVVKAGLKTPAAGTGKITKF